MKFKLFFSFLMLTSPIIFADGVNSYNFQVGTHVYASYGNGYVVGLWSASLDVEDPAGTRPILRNASVYKMVDTNIGQSGSGVLPMANVNMFRRSKISRNVILRIGQSEDTFVLNFERNTARRGGGWFTWFAKRVPMKLSHTADYKQNSDAPVWALNANCPTTLAELQKQK